MSGFVHLHCHSEYSIKDSTITMAGFVNRAKQLGFESLALTDSTNFFAAVKFYQHATTAGIKPIFGAELSLKDKQGLVYQVICLCQTYQGYQNLSALISKGYLEYQYLAEVVLPEHLLAEHHQDLIVISPMLTGDISQLLLAGKTQQAEDKATFWQQHFQSRYYLGVARMQKPNETIALQSTVKLAAQKQLAIVASNAVQFLSATDFESHEVRVCIASGDLLDDDKRVQKYTPAQYLKSALEMQDLFSDLPEALENSVQIAKRCNVEFSLYQKKYLPNFPVPKGLSIDQFFTQESQKGLNKRLKNLDVDKPFYQSRLNYEMSIIVKMGFTGYFLIVADFIAYAKNNGIPVGPGRGSGAGSLVAYALNITNVDPIRHDLLFERFLNPERVSMPDFDIDFCTNGRDVVIAYVAQKYGQEKVGQIVTHGTMAAKGVIRDVARVLGHPYRFGDSLSKLIPNDLNITLSRALGRFSTQDKKEDKGRWFSPDLLAKYDADESIKTTIDLSLKLEGLARSVGTHAGGVVIAPSRVGDFCPIYKGTNEKDSIVSQFDMNDLEAVGLVKFDFLGLSNLTVIDKTLTTLEQQGKTKGRLNIDKLPLDDEAVYQLLQAGHTTGIFQLESEGIRKYLKDLKADSFEDIVAMLALYRPGPLENGMVEDYIAVKHKKKVIEYPHPILEEILKPTNGGFLYQEQVMKAAQTMADYSLGEADILRRAMGKKKPKEMKKQRSVFVAGAVKKGIDKDKAHEIFDLIDKFSGYGFNKSHSVAYALISYQTAYLKAHYPAFFMACVLSSVMDNSDRVAFTINEVRRMGIAISPPNINLSTYEFSVKDQSIIYGLGAIKGMGRSLAEALSKERQKASYRDLLDFCYRIDKVLLNRRALEALILAGAFDEMVANRHELLNTFPRAVQHAEQYQKDKNSAQGGLFAKKLAKVRYVDIALLTQKWTEQHQLYQEKQVMGYFFSAHPSDFYKEKAQQLNIDMPSTLNKHHNHFVELLGMVINMRTQDSQDGSYVLFDLCDAQQSLFVVLPTLKKQPAARVENGQTLAKQPSAQLENEQMVYIRGTLKKSYRENGWRIQADKLIPIDHIYQKIEEITLKLSIKHQAIFSRLATILKNYPGTTPLNICYQTADAQGLLKATSVQPNADLVDELTQLLEGRLIDMKMTSEF